MCARVGFDRVYVDKGMCVGSKRVLIGVCILPSKGVPGVSPKASLSLGCMLIGVWGGDRVYVNRGRVYIANKGVYTRRVLPIRVYLVFLLAPQCQ